MQRLRDRRRGGERAIEASERRAPQLAPITSVSRFAALPVCAASAIGRDAEPREPAHDRRGDERLAGAGTAGDDRERARRARARPRAAAPPTAAAAELGEQVRRSGGDAPAVDARSAMRAATRCSSQRERSVYRQPSSTISGSRASPTPITESKRGAAVSCAIRLSVRAHVELEPGDARDVLRRASRSGPLRIERQPRRALALRDHQREHEDRERLGIAAAEPAIGGDQLLGEVEPFVAEVAAPRTDAEPAEHVVGAGGRARARHAARAACRAGAAARSRPRLLARSSPSQRRPARRAVVVDPHRHDDAVAHEREQHAGEPARAAQAFGGERRRAAPAPRSARARARARPRRRSAPRARRSCSRAPTARRPTRRARR